MVFFPQTTVCRVWLDSGSCSFPLSEEELSLVAVSVGRCCHSMSGCFSQLVDGCITGDGDAFLYGANTVYRNFSCSKNKVCPHVVPFLQVRCFVQPLKLAAKTETVSSSFIRRKNKLALQLTNNPHQKCLCLVDQGSGLHLAL